MQLLANETCPTTVALLMEFTEDWTERDVPDPLLSASRFDVVMDMIEDACSDLYYELVQSIIVLDSLSKGQRTQGFDG